jgi:hypothetical protein
VKAVLLPVESVLEYGGETCWGESLLAWLFVSYRCSVWVFLTYNVELIGDLGAGMVTYCRNGTVETRFSYVTRDARDQDRVVASLSDLRYRYVPTLSTASSNY